MIRTRVAVLFLLATLAACGNSSDDAMTSYSSPSAGTFRTDTASQPPSPVTSTKSSATQGRKMDASAFATVSGDCSGQPQLNVKTGAAPATSLVTEDICPGTGAVVRPGATVTAHYIGIGLATGKKFDSSWDRGEPIAFPLSGVIQGWSQGVPGMHVGGRRLLVVPGDMAYGPNPPTPDIAPNETLVFVVDIISSP